ncbi:hypothetical protein [Paenibacillus sp. CMAA1364]
MILKLRFELFLGALGFVITFVTSSIHNVFMTSLIRASIAFVIWFVIATICKRVLSIMTTQPVDIDISEEAEPHEDQKGTRFDLTLPNDTEDLNELLKPKADSSNADELGFAPLNPPKLISGQDPEQLAKAVRHLTEK